jgi:hypothetical protein
MTVLRRAASALAFVFFVCLLGRSTGEAAGLRHDEAESSKPLAETAQRLLATKTVNLIEFLKV